MCSSKCRLICRYGSIFQALHWLDALSDWLTDWCDDGSTSDNFPKRTVTGITKIISSLCLLATRKQQATSNHDATIIPLRSGGPSHDGHTISSGVFDRCRAGDWWHEPRVPYRQTPYDYRRVSPDQVSSSTTTTLVCGRCSGRSSCTRQPL